MKGNEIIERAEEIRKIIFGIGYKGLVVPVLGYPETIAQCGMYIHVEDIQKFLEFQKDLETP